MWTPEAQESFDLIKERPFENPIFSMFDPDLPVVFSTNASDYGLGAVLQKGDVPALKTVAYVSRTLSDTERRYMAGEKDALACTWTSDKWHDHLWGHISLW